MGKKYIYGRRTDDNPFLVRENEFHFLCKYLGAYLKYEKEIDFYDGFDNYLKIYNINEAISNNTCWSYINEAQKYIRDTLNDTEVIEISPYQNSKKHIFSKREIRKLGYYGALTTPALPKNACEIETIMFNTIFKNDRFKDVAICFNDYLFDSWKRNENKANYFSCENSNALKVTTSYFIGFQQNIIDDNRPKFKDLFREFKANFGYIYIQEGLDNRHT